MLLAVLLPCRIPCGFRAVFYIIPYLPLRRYCTDVLTEAASAEMEVLQLSGYGPEWGRSQSKIIF